MFASADSIKSFLLAVQVTFLLIMFLLVMFSFLLTEIESADYVSAGHVLTNPNNVQSQQFQQFQTATISANNAKFPYLEKEKYEIWAMKMEYWIQNADHNLWRIVQQGNSPKRLGKDAKGNTIVHPPVSLDEHVLLQKEIRIKEDEEDHAQAAVYRILCDRREGYLRAYEQDERIDELQQSRVLDDKAWIMRQEIKTDEVVAKILLKAQKKRKEWEVKFEATLARFEKISRLGEMHAVPPPITGTYMPSPYQSDIEETQVSDKSSDSGPMNPVIQASRTKTKELHLLLISRLCQCMMLMTQIPLTGSSSFLVGEWDDVALCKTSAGYVVGGIRSQILGAPEGIGKNLEVEMVEYQEKAPYGPQSLTLKMSTMLKSCSTLTCSLYHKSVIKRTKFFFSFTDMICWCFQKNSNLPDESGDGQKDGSCELQKQINKLAKEGWLMVTSNVFTNAHNCVACNKGKQHKASYKHISAVRLITESLQLLHMDLFGPTNIRSIDQKYYSLVVTDDFSRHLKPFGCQVKISFNQVTYLGKFEGKLVLKDILLGMLPIAGTQETNINAGTQDHDSDSEVDEQVIVVPSFPSNRFAGPSSSNGPSVMERNADYAEELAKLQRQEYEAKDAAARYGSVAIDSAVRNLDGIVLADGVSTAVLLLNSDLLLMSLHFILRQQMGSSENTTRFPVPSDVCMDPISSGIFTSSSYDDDFRATLTNLAPAVEVNPVPTKREPTSIAKALEDPDWVAAMQEEMQQFINQQVKETCPLTEAKPCNRDKMDFEEQAGCQRHSYCFWLLLLIWAFWYISWTLRGSAFSMEKLKKNVYVTQLKAFEDPYFKASCLQSGQSSVWTSSTAPRAWSNLKWCTMGEMTFFIRHQVTPLTSHLNAVKKIFKYLKGQPKLGLWYPKDSPFQLEAYSDSDYAGSHGDRKSTTGGCQFLGRRLISWQCKKQTIVATSSTEAEYVAAASCCAQVLWIQNQLLDYGFNFMNTKIFIDNQSTICIVKNPVFHQRTKHIEIRHHFIRDANEKNLIQVLKIHTDENVADLLTKAFDGPRFEYLVVHIGMVVNTAARCTFFLLVDSFLLIGYTFLLSAWLLLVAMDSAAASVYMLVVILLLVDLFLLIGYTFLLSAWLLLVAMDSAADSVYMLVDSFLLIGYTFLLSAWFLLVAMDSAAASVYMMVVILLLVDSFMLTGFVYAANTSIHAAGLVCAGGIMFLLADLFLLVVTCFCCAQLDI
ncbi:hypothetical protein Tco_0505798 [Tanacetum coccineum]